MGIFGTKDQTDEPTAEQAPVAETQQQDPSQAVEEFKQDFYEKARAWGRDRGYGSEVESFIRSMESTPTTSAQTSTEVDDGKRGVSQMLRLDVEVSGRVDASMADTIGYASDRQIKQAVEDIFDFTPKKKEAVYGSVLDRATIDGLTADVVGIEVVRTSA